MDTVTDVLDRARSQIGYNGGGDTSNPVTVFGEWFGAQTQWCAEFASWCLYNEGVDPLGRWPKGEDYCPAWVASYQAHGRWTLTPEPGNLVFYSWDRNSVADHVGLVESVNDDGTITTIEGNTDDPTMWQYEAGNCCRRKVRNTFYVMGYGQPLYESETPEVDTATPVTAVEDDDMFELIKADGNASVYEFSINGLKGFTSVRTAMALANSPLNKRQVKSGGRWQDSVRHVTGEELALLIGHFGKRI